MPARTLPVTLHMSGSGWETSLAPVSRSPQITLMTPAGRNSDMSCAIHTVETGVGSDGLRPTPLPAATAGPHLHTAIIIGQFHGVTCAHTPTGSRRIIEV